MRLFCPTLACLLLALLPGLARAAPNDGFALSDDAALMAGAVVASGRDVASSWYNPALITSTDRLRAEVSATAYGVRWVRARRGLTLRDPTTERRAALSSREFLVVPSAFSIGSAVGERVSVGFGFFTPKFAERILSGQGGVTTSDAFTTDVKRTNVQRHYHTGPIVGVEVAEGLDLGFALFGVYDKSSVTQRTFIEYDADAGRSSLLQETESTVRSYGLQAMMGVRGRLGQWIRAGASVRTPTVVVVQRIEGVDLGLESVTDASGSTRTTSDYDPVPVRRRPARIESWTVATGLAVVRRRWAVELDAEASPEQYPNNPTVGRAAHWNVRLGVRYRPSRRWTFGGGVFTDRNDSRETSLGSLRIDLLGVAAGVQLRTPITLGEKERENRIAFRTTVGLRYAGGTGRAGAFEADYGEDSPAPRRIDFDADTDATMHLLTVHVGSGLDF